MSNWRRVPEAAWVAVGLLAAFAVAEVIPGSSRGLGTPLAVLALGAVLGLVDGLTAAGLVLVYRTSGVINFAQVSIGAAGAVFCFDLMQMTPLPFWFDVTAGLLIAGAIGFLFQVVVERRFASSPRLVLTILTVAAGAFLSGTVQSVISSLPFFPPANQRDSAVNSGTQALGRFMPFDRWYATLPGLPLRFTFAHVFACALAVALLAALTAFFRFTRFGVAVRAMAQNRERAALLGMSVGLLSGLVWSLAGVLSGATLLLRGLIYVPGAVTGFAPQLLLVPFAAATLARWRSLPAAMAAAVAYSTLAAAFSYHQPEAGQFLTVAALVVIGGGLFLQTRNTSRSDSQTVGLATSVAEQRPVPKEMMRLPVIAAFRWGGGAVLAVAIAVFPFAVATNYQVTGSVIIAEGILALSIVVLTGWAGQVSLGQYAFMGMGALAAADLGIRASLPFWLAVPGAMLVTAAIAVVVGLPALRIPGLFLAAVTLSLAAVAHDVVFSPQNMWLVPQAGLDRPSLFGADFSSERSMYFLSLVLLILAYLAVRNLRRSRFGRVLLAVRDNEPNAAAAGIAATRIKVLGFAVAGALAGLSGGLYAYVQRGFSADAFTLNHSYTFFLFAVLGGISSMWGVVAALVLTSVIDALMSNVPDVYGVLNLPVLVLLFLYLEPGGIAALASRVRDGVLRVIAERNGLIVPSLFADVDPASLHLRLIQLGAALPASGLATIPRRYKLARSVLAVRDGDDGPSQETEAIQAAARNATVPGLDPLAAMPSIGRLP